jgi:hypothetical protein
MTAAEVLDVLRARDIRRTVDGEQWCYDAPKEAMTADVLPLLRQQKMALLALLQQEPSPIAAPVHAEPRHYQSVPL